MRGWRRPSIEPRGSTQVAPITAAAQIAQALATQFPSSPAWSSELSVPAYLGGGQIDSLIPARGTSGPSNFGAFNAPNAPSNTQTLLYWTGKAQWYSGNGGEWYFVGGLTGRYPGSQTVVRYSVASDRFTHFQGDSYLDEASDCFDGYGCAHNFDGACINPTTGKLYRFMPYQRVGGVENADNWTLAEWDANASTGRALASSNGYGADDFRSTEWFSDIGKVVVRRIGASDWTTYDPAGGGTWSTISNSRTWVSPALCYHGGFVYAADGTTFWRLKTDGTLESRATLPATMYGGSDAVADHAILVSLGPYIYAFANRTVYRYDPAGDSWGGSAYDAFSWASSAEDAHFTVGPLRLAGGDVALFVRSIDDWTHQALLWKP